MATQIPLILDMKPIDNRLGPAVYLDKLEHWEISLIGWKDSEIELISQGIPKLGDSGINMIPGDRLLLKGGEKLMGGLKQVVIKKAGSEGKITIFATKVAH